MEMHPSDFEQELSPSCSVVRPAVGGIRVPGDPDLGESGRSGDSGRFAWGSTDGNVWLEFISQQC